ncbi:biotin transporter BioY [Mangrovicoccus sp. HB161399]|uniref:biotin transporter BioY n=1 Tax=Mangrovicoccus sp. HB161399 TaxID=2720392 RepID=UPI0015518E2A|nr:biotin transporter BioY [Mangrovicoccus sp. HB161399]
MHHSAGTRSRPLWKEAALVLGAAAAMAAAANIEVPFYPVPMTLQTLAVTGAGLALGMRRGVASVATYVGAGLAGLPVFAGGKFGLMALTGPTGGYILGFLIAAAFAGMARDRGWTRSLPGALVSALVATALVFPTGLWHLGNVIGWDKPVLDYGLTPFIFGGIFKSLIAGLGAWALARRSA